MLRPIVLVALLTLAASAHAATAPTSSCSGAVAPAPAVEAEVDATSTPYAGVAACQQATGVPAVIVSHPSGVAVRTASLSLGQASVGLAADGTGAAAAACLPWVTVGPVWLSSTVGSVFTPSVRVPLPCTTLTLP